MSRRPWVIRWERYPICRTCFREWACWSTIGPLQRPHPGRVQAR